MLLLEQLTSNVLKSVSSFLIFFTEPNHIWNWKVHCFPSGWCQALPRSWCWHECGALSVFLLKLWHKDVGIAAVSRVGQGKAATASLPDSSNLLWVLAESRVNFCFLSCLPPLSEEREGKNLSEQAGFHLITNRLLLLPQELAPELQWH